MNTPYLHWDANKTLERMFDDRATVCELIRVFLDQYPASLQRLRLSAGKDPRLIDEVHNLRSLFGIFYAENGHAMVLAMDRELRAGQEVPDTARLQLIEELEGLARELEHFVSSQRSS